MSKRFSTMVILLVAFAVVVTSCSAPPTPTPTPRPTLLPPPVAPTSSPQCPRRLCADANNRAADDSAHRDGFTSLAVANAFNSLADAFAANQNTGAGYKGPGGFRDASRSAGAEREHRLPRERKWTRPRTCPES